MYRVIIYGNQDIGEEYIIEDTVIQTLEEADRYLKKRLAELDKNPCDGRIKVM